MTERMTHRLREDPPTTAGFMGDPVPHPAFVGVTCDVCNKYGYVPETSAEVVDERDAAMVCEECG